jgi:hypothetical protein
VYAERLAAGDQTVVTVTGDVDMHSEGRLRDALTG